MAVLAGMLAASAPAQAQQGPVTSGGAASRMVIAELPAAGIALHGTLPASAPPCDGRPTVWYTVKCRPGITLQVDVRSSWDNVVVVLDPSGRQVAFEGDSTHPHVFTCRVLRTYLVGVGASSAANVGRYTVEMNQRGIPSVFRQAVPIPLPVVLGSISVGATVAGEATRDRPMYGSWAHTAFYRFQCQGGQAITVAITKTDERTGFTALLADTLYT